MLPQAGFTVGGSGKYEDRRKIRERVISVDQPGIFFVLRARDTFVALYLLWDRDTLQLNFGKAVNSQSVSKESTSTFENFCARVFLVFASWSTSLTIIGQ
jgi:hypothetical protein